MLCEKSSGIIEKQPLEFDLICIQAYHNKAQDSENKAYGGDGDFDRE